MSGGQRRKTVPDEMIEVWYRVADALRTKPPPRLPCSIKDACPECGNHYLEQEEVDVGVCNVVGPLRCPCGWTEESMFGDMPLWAQANWNT